MAMFLRLWALLWRFPLEILPGKEDSLRISGGLKWRLGSGFKALWMARSLQLRKEEASLWVGTGSRLI